MTLCTGLLYTDTVHFSIVITNCFRSVLGHKNLYVLKYKLHTKYYRFKILILQIRTLINHVNYTVTWLIVLCFNNVIAS